MALNLSRCAVAPARQRRLFWATQASCGSVPLCQGPSSEAAKDCGSAGLVVECIPDPCDLGCHDDCPPRILGTKISTGNWVSGLVLNILLTDARFEDSECGSRPGNRGGHWSESFRGDNRKTGSRIRQIDADCSIGETLQLVEGYVEDDLSSLLVWGVAKSIDVVATYGGSNRVDTTITIIGERDDEIRVGVTGTRLKNGWVWGSQR